MTSRKYLPRTWMDPRQDIRPSAIHGMGIFASQPIRQGEPVEIIGGDLMTEAEFRAFQQTADRYYAVQIGDDLHLVERLAIIGQRLGSINHACDSNLWLADEVTLVAKRDIKKDEEITVDYALFSAQSDWVMDNFCRCGQPVCRGTITGIDWRLKEVQARYRGHFTPFLNVRIENLSQDR